MALSIRLRQLARLLGDEALSSELIAAGDDLPPERRQCLQAAVEAHLPRIVQGLLEEAVASDDVVDGASADAFLEDRLLFLGDLLTDEQRQAVREGYRRASRSWRQQAR
jgi:uncharacterized membrane protein